MRAGPDSRAGGSPGAVHIRCLLVPDPGECGRGPDQPAEQRLGVRAPFVIHLQILRAFCKFVSEMEGLSHASDHVSS